MLKAEQSGPAGGWPVACRKKGGVKKDSKEGSMLVGEAEMRLSSGLVLSWVCSLFPVPCSQLHSGGNVNSGFLLSCHEAQNQEFAFHFFCPQYMGNKPGEC